jgi:hypothetical protein
MAAKIVIEPIFEAAFEDCRALRATFHGENSVA